jgi:16S rRNA C967 or C1407 C5-methylase (RsmB/RsmF family)
MSHLSPEFEKYYSEIYQDRWPGLLKALERPEIQSPRPNAFAGELPDWNLEGEIPRSANGVLSYYIMDLASIAAAKSLDVQLGDKVLDMCAAPGGKTLILAEAQPSELIANELSNDRRARLMKVLQQYIPREKRDSIFVTGKDGGRFALTHKDYFDRILVDAPCSGERHLLKNQKEMKEWSLSRTKKLAQRQYALLTAALLAVKPGGRIVYSTCSISNLENDGVIAELIKRKGQASTGQVFKVLPATEFLPATPFEKTEFGSLYLPDRSSVGPIYFSILQRC